VTLSFLAKATRADGVLSVDALPQMITEEIRLPPASTTSPGAAPTNVEYPSPVTRIAEAKLHARATVVNGGSAMGKITACMVV
jgi:hypothetical protein